MTGKGSGTPATSEGITLKQRLQHLIKVLQTDPDEGAQAEIRAAVEYVLDEPYTEGLAQLVQGLNPIRHNDTLLALAAALFQLAAARAPAGTYFGYKATTPSSQDSPLGYWDIPAERGEGTAG